MSALNDRLMALLEAGPLPEGEGWGALVRLRDEGGEPLGFAGRLQGGAELRATVAEAGRLALEADARFGAAGREGAIDAIELYLVREGEQVSEAAPLLPGEGVHVVGGHRRAVYLSPPGHSPVEVLRGGCIAAGLHPKSWEDEAGPRITRLTVHRLG
ncbi:MAG: hypothetical protein P1V51_16490 [Deltaproteobacteria bacterium]|nr:hypothetical protein [Deltaproteobacteria bacterium]